MWQLPSPNLSDHQVTRNWPWIKRIRWAWTFSFQMVNYGGDWGTIQWLMAVREQGWSISGPLSSQSSCWPWLSSTQRCCRAQSGSVGHRGCRDWWHRTRLMMRWSWHRGCRAAWDTEPLAHQHEMDNNKNKGGSSTQGDREQIEAILWFLGSQVLFGSLLNKPWDETRSLSLKLWGRPFIPPHLWDRLIISTAQIVFMKILRRKVLDPRSVWVTSPFWYSNSHP